MPQVFTVMFVCLFLGACASNNTTTDANGKVVEVKEEKQKMRCTRGRGTGSRLENRVCVPVDD